MLERPLIRIYHKRKRGEFMKYLYGEKETRKISLICFGILTLALFLLYAIGSWAYKAPIGVEHITPKRIDPVLITLFKFALAVRFSSVIGIL